MDRIGGFLPGATGVNTGLSRNKEKSQEIIKLYQEGYSSLKIAKIYDTTYNTIIRILDKNNIPRRSNKINSRQYNLNHNFFNNIDNEEKAYWLGFLYADGYLSFTLDDKRPRKIVGLSLGIKDINHLNKFNTCLESTYSIKIYTNTGFVKQGYPATKYGRLCFTSDQLFDDLAKLGCIEHKTQTLKFPTEEQVPQYLLHHFLRGFMDGDGSIKITQPKDNKCIRFGLDFCGTTEMLDGIQKFFNTQLKLSKRHKNKTNNYSLSYGGNQSVYKKLLMLYKDATIYLDRKYERFLQLQNYINSRA